MEIKTANLEIDQDEIEIMQEIILDWLSSEKGYECYIDKRRRFIETHQLYFGFTGLCYCGNDTAITVEDLKSEWKEKGWMKDENQTN